MKQHITREQVEELEWESLVKLAEMLPKEFQNTKDSETERFITIGKMIEILQPRYRNAFKHKKGFEVSLNVFPLGPCISVVKTFDEPELCDALWEAVKHILGGE